MWNDTVIEAIRRWTDKVIDLSAVNMGVYHWNCIEDKQSIIKTLLSEIKYLEPARRHECVSYIATYVDGLPDELMLATDDIKTLYNSGIEIGAHTVNHPIMTCISEVDAISEMGDSRAQLEEIIGDTVRFFAYPNGIHGVDYSNVHAKMVKKLGFRAALTTHHGVANRQSDSAQLPRFTPWDDKPTRFMLRAAQIYLKTK